MGCCYPVIGISDDAKFNSFISKIQRSTNKLDHDFIDMLLLKLCKIFVEKRLIRFSKKDSNIRIKIECMFLVSQTVLLGKCDLSFSFHFCYFIGHYRILKGLANLEVEIL